MNGRAFALTGALALLAARAEAQVVVDATDYVDTSGFMSPPRVLGPLTTCLEPIVVVGALPGAEVQLELAGLSGSFDIPIYAD